MFVVCMISVVHWANFMQSKESIRSILADSVQQSHSSSTSQSRVK